MKKQTDTRSFVIILILRKAVKFPSLNFPNDDNAQIPFFFSLGHIPASFPNLHFGAAIAHVYSKTSGIFSEEMAMKLL